MRAAAYPHEVQSLLDYARLKMRETANRGEFDERACGQVEALSWLNQIDPADETAFRNEKYFLVDRANQRRREKSAGAKT